MIVPSPSLLQFVEQMRPDVNDRARPTCGVVEEHIVTSRCWALGKGSPGDGCNGFCGSGVLHRYTPLLGKLEPSIGFEPTTTTATKELPLHGLGKLVAGAGFEPATFGLWVRRGSNSSTLRLINSSPLVRSRRFDVDVLFQIVCGFAQ